jgi:hypothetical protein
MGKPEAKVEFEMQLPSPAYGDGVRCVQKNTFLHIEEASPINRRPRSKSDVTTLRSSYQEEEEREGSTVDEDSPRGRQSRLESLDVDDVVGHETPQFSAVLGPAPPPMESLELPGTVAVTADVRPRRKKEMRRSDVTLMLRNIPNKYTQDALLDELSQYVPSIDFFYLPIDFRNQCNLGYAFLNFKDGEAANAFQAAYDGLRLARFPQSPKVLQVHMARVQGLQANVKRLRNSSVMGMLTEDSKPVLFEGGEMKTLGHTREVNRRGRRPR